MYGTRDEFSYFKCSNCGCLQIEKVPENLGDYYTTNYYSFELRKKPAYKRAAKAMRIKMALQFKHLNSKSMKILGGVPPYIDWLKIAGVKYTSNILDVGSGAGELLMDMSNVGFENLTGVDPFIEVDKELGPGCNLYKQDLTEHDGKYDFIMFNHSLEHVENQHEYLAKAFDLLNENGTIMVRVPLVDSYAWEKYKTNWVQLDPPRHLYLHTKESVKLMSEKASLDIKETVYDSTDFQFWASELYQKDTSLMDENNQCIKSPKGRFSREEIKEFRNKADQLNQNQKGDQAAFFLVKQ